MGSVSTKVEAFFASYPVRKYKKGQILLLEGDEPKLIYLLLKGSVKQYDVNYRGEEIVVNLFKPGAFFPMSHALNGGISHYIFEADTEIELRQAPANEVVSFLSSNPDVTLDLLSRVYRGTDSLLGRIVQLAGGSAKSRLCYELVVTAKRFGEQDGNRYILHVTEKDLAARAGLSRETVSRAMQKLKAQGLVQLNDNKIIIQNLSSIESLLSP